MDDTEYLADKRFLYNLTQQELADALGVAYQTVANWERGRTRVPKWVRCLDWPALEPAPKPGAPRLIRKDANNPFRRNNLGIIPADRANGRLWPK